MGRNPNPPKTPKVDPNPRETIGEQLAADDLAASEETPPAFSGSEKVSEPKSALTAKSGTVLERRAARQAAKREKLSKGEI